MLAASGKAEVRSQSCGPVIGAAASDAPQGSSSLPLQQNFQDINNGEACIYAVQDVCPLLALLVGV